MLKLRISARNVVFLDKNSICIYNIEKKERKIWSFFDFRIWNKRLTLSNYIHSNKITSVEFKQSGGSQQYKTCCSVKLTKSRNQTTVNLQLKWSNNSPLISRINVDDQTELILPKQSLCTHAQYYRVHVVRETTIFPSINQSHTQTTWNPNYVQLAYQYDSQWCLMDSFLSYQKHKNNLLKLL